VVGAGCSLTPEHNKVVMDSRPELHQSKKERLNVNSVEFRLRKDHGPGSIEVTTIWNVYGDIVPSIVPVFLLRKELAVLQPARLSRFHKIFASDVFPRTFITTGGTSHPAFLTHLRQVAGVPWVLDSQAKVLWEQLLQGVCDAKAAIQPLCDQAGSPVSVQATGSPHPPDELGNDAPVVEQSSNE